MCTPEDAVIAFDKELRLLCIKAHGCVPAW